jgi:hypothetical protein
MRRGTELLNLTFQGTSDRVRGLFVNLDGGLDNPVGVNRDSYKANEKGTVTVIGTAMVLVGTGGATRGLGIEADTDGRGILSGASGAQGIAVTTEVENDYVEVILTLGGVALA